MFKYLSMFFSFWFLSESFVAFIGLMFSISVIATTFFLQKVFKIKSTFLQLILVSLVLQALAFVATVFVIFGWQWMPMAWWIESMMDETQSFFGAALIIWVGLFLVLLPILSLCFWLILKSPALKSRAFPKLSLSVKATLLAVWSFWSLFFVTVGTVLAAWSVDDACYGARTAFHEFNAHLKDVCIDSDKPWECPRNESELIAFNPELFKKIQRCAFTEYRFNENNQEFEWRVNFPGKWVLISHPDYYPGYGSE